MAASTRASVLGLLGLAWVWLWLWFGFGLLFSGFRHDFGLIYVGFGLISLGFARIWLGFWLDLAWIFKLSLAFTRIFVHSSPS